MSLPSSHVLGKYCWNNAYLDVSSMKRRGSVEVLWGFPWCLKGIWTLFERLSNIVLTTLMYSTNHYPILRAEASGYGFKSLIQLRTLFQPVEQIVSASGTKSFKRWNTLWNCRLSIIFFLIDSFLIVFGSIFVMAVLRRFSPVSRLLPGGLWHVGT